MKPQCASYPQDSVVSCFSGSVTNYACWQLQPSGSWFVLLSTGLIISSFTAQHRRAFSSQNHSSSDADNCPDCESPVFLSQWYFSSALVSPASDEEKTCESVTHGCTHDSGPNMAHLKRNEHDDESEWMTATSKIGNRLIPLKTWNVLVLSERAGFL